MKYQALKRLKTKSKLIGLCDTLLEAHKLIRKDGGEFVEFAYIGGWPVYRNNDTGRVYNIQGLVEDLNIVCSLNKDELQKFNFGGTQLPF